MFGGMTVGLPFEDRLWELRFGVELFEVEK